MAARTEGHRLCRGGDAGTLAPGSCSMTDKTGRGGGYVLVTGGAGFLGTNISNALAARGDDVVVFDNFSRPRVVENGDWLSARHPGKVRIVKGDVRDADALGRAVEGAS